MKIGLDVLRRWVDLPDDAHAVRILLDQCGLEVKRVDASGPAVGFTLELLANRGDHHCYDGVARELYGHLGTALHVPAVSALVEGPSPVPLRVDSDLCLVYTATLLVRGPSARERLDPAAVRVLEAAGLSPVSAPVDATNVTNLELGQPTHAFDADTLDGGIVVRLSRAGERAWPLFRPEPVNVPEGTMVIADDAKILAIAGVIGCEESKTTAGTTRLLLESATFDPVAVRKASRALGIQTDSSARFERGADPERPLVGAGRVADLLGAVGWSVVGATGVERRWSNPGRVLAVDPAEASRFLAVALDAAEIATRLARYGFQVRVDGERLAVSVPTWRLWDVEFPADLYEELAKSLGYDATPVELPDIGLGALPSPAETRRARIEEVLLGQGFYEVFTDGFYGRDVFGLLGIAEGDPLYDHVQITNALDRGYALLKNNALHQAIVAVGVNERRRTADGKMFEWTRTFHPRDYLPARAVRTEPPCTERSVLWMLAFGADRPRAWHDTSRPADVTHLKGVLHELGVELGLDLELSALPDSGHPLAPFLHPGRRAAVTLMGDVVGVVGEVHPAVCRRYKLKSVRPCYAELDAEAILTEGARPVYTEPPEVQPLVRSVAFELPARVDAGDVAAWLHASGPDWLERVRIVDCFVPAAVPGQAPLRSVTFELHYANPEARRTAEEVNAATEATVRAVLDQFGPRGVRQR